MFELKDKVIVLTGATGVLGSELALSLAKANAKLVILGRNEGLLDELKKKLFHLTYVEYHVVNVLDRHELEKVRTSIIQTLGQIDSLVNAVGGNLPGAVIPDDKNIFNLSETDFDEVVEMNLKGTILPSIVLGGGIAMKGKVKIFNDSSLIRAKSAASNEGPIFAFNLVLLNKVDMMKLFMRIQYTSILNRINLWSC